MKNKAPDFMDLLETFFTGHLPYSAGLSANTIRSYKYAFRLLMEFLYTVKNIPADAITFSALDYSVLSEFLLWLENERNCSVSTRNQRLAALSSFASYSQNRSFDAAAVFMNSLQKIPVKKLVQKPRTVFNREEVTILLALPDVKSRTGKRDQALLSVMYASGARAQEICDLTVRDISFDKDRTRMTIAGKGNKTRRVIIARPCAELLKRFIRDKNLADKPERHIFSSQTHEHMTLSCIEEIYKKYVRLARVQHPELFREEHYSPHTMRHTCATHMLEAGVPMMAIKNFLGHSSLSTTERYAALSQSTVDKHIREWNDKWFPETKEADHSETRKNFPDFLK